MLNHLYFLGWCWSQIGKFLELGGDKFSKPSDRTTFDGEGFLHWLNFDAIFWWHILGNKIMASGMDALKNPGQQEFFRQCFCRVIGSSPPTVDVALITAFLKSHTASVYRWNPDWATSNSGRNVWNICTFRWYKTTSNVSKLICFPLQIYGFESNRALSTNEQEM